MESEMVQNSTSNFSITFNKHDQIQRNSLFRINKCDRNQRKKYNQLQIRLKLDQIQHFTIIVKQQILSHSRGAEKFVNVSPNPLRRLWR